MAACRYLSLWGLVTSLVLRLLFSFSLCRLVLLVSSVLPCSFRFVCLCYSVAGPHIWCLCLSLGSNSQRCRGLFCRLILDRGPNWWLLSWVRVFSAYDLLTLAGGSNGVCLPARGVIPSLSLVSNRRVFPFFLLRYWALGYISRYFFLCARFSSRE